MSDIFTVIENVQIQETSVPSTTDGLLEEQRDKYEALLRSISLQLGELEDREATARAEKLAVAAKFTAVEKLLGQIKNTISILNGEIIPEDELVRKNQPQRMVIAAKNGRGRKSVHDPRVPEAITKIVQSLGGIARPGQIMNGLVKEIGCEISYATYSYYKYRDKILEETQNGLGWKVKGHVAHATH